MNLRGLTSFSKFNIDGVIPKPHGMNLASIFQHFSAFVIFMVLVTHALRNEEPTRKIELSENI